MVTTSRQGDRAVLTVADNGVGIPTADQPHVFERFYRVDKARSGDQAGSGLGLAICQRIVEAHRGKMSFTSRPDEGTTFRVELPRLPTDKSDVRTGTTQSIRR
jgi:signal transduction histidine kinase